MTRIPVHFDLGAGGAMAHVLGDFLGANRTAWSRRRALAKIRAEVPSYAAWLRAHGERVAVPRRVELVVAEEVRGQDPWIAGGTNALFGPERRPAREADIERCLRRMAWNREETLALVRDVPGMAMGRAPRGEPRSIGNTLSHIANAELWYVSRLGRSLEAVWRRLPRDPFERLARVRRVVAVALGSLTPRERSAVFIPTAWCSPRQRMVGEPWTARKVLRRLLEHERQHAAYVARLVAVRA